MNYIHKDHIIDEETAFLAKPFTPEELLRKVKGVLQKSDE